MKQYNIKNKTKRQSRSSFTCKDGTVRYPLPNCSICEKRSNTTDKETAQIAWRKGRICQACTASLTNKDKSIWQKIKRWFQ